MQPINLENFKAGEYRKINDYEYFLPSPINRAFYWTDPTINELLEKASFELGELNSFANLVPDVDMFIKMLVYKEAVVSSRIEGTQTNMEEALSDEKDIEPERRDDWREVNNYVKAMNYAIDRLKTLPISARLIKEAHKILLSSVRGTNKSPGEFRKSQNWIGGATIHDAVFVPPIHTEIPKLISDLENFLNNNELRLPHLIKIAIAHYQFETIHPFLDGNGRVGRLLITLYLVANNILEKPLLYLSDFFEKNRLLYYQNLDSVRKDNSLIRWVRFFLEGVVETSEKSIATLKEIIDLKNRIEKEKILLMGKRTKNGLKLLQYLFSQPVITSKDVQKILGLSPKAASDIIKSFMDLGILKEITGYRRNRVFIFKEYLKTFSR